MKINVLSAIFALLVVLISFATSAHCQTSQAGSVAIAESIRVEGVNELDEFAKCVSALKTAGASYKEAAKDCKDYRKVLAKESTRIANEAADATKASRPFVVVYDLYGYSGGSRRVVVVSQMSSREEIHRPRAQARREAQPRPDPRPRPAAKPRPAASPRPTRSR